MIGVQTVEPSATTSPLRSLDRLFEAAKKRTIIQLRWPLVILCSYLLLYAPDSWLTAAQTNAVLVFYLLTNATLYFVADDFFDSPYFYGPLLLFDTILLVASLAVSGGATPDFYLACFFTLLLSCVCNNSRGLFVVTLLAPAIYAYVVFSSSATHDSSVYLRLPFPLVIAMFYGYFAQVERIKRIAKEKEEQARRQQQAAEEVRQQRERLEVLREINLAVTSTMDPQKLIDVFLETARMRLPYAAAILRLRNQESKVLETIGSQGIDTTELSRLTHPLGCFDEIGELRSPLKIDNVFTDPRITRFELFRQEELVSFVEIPMIANDEVLGSLIFLTRQEHAFVEEEIEFLSTVAGQAAIAIHHSQLFDEVQRQADALRQANKAKDEFLGVVSHELKTPLNVISGYSNMLSEGMLGDVTPIQEKALQTVSRQSKELHHVIDSVLQVNHIEAEILQPEYQEVNFWEFLSELRAFYDYPVGKDLKLVWEFRADLPTLYADKGKLRHILENLINNAIKFTDQGTVTIAARNLPAKKLMEFKVTDTGIGIPKELLPSIFERFRQVDSSDTKIYGGVGLGLYIVKKYTGLLGGTIQVESKLGQGSAFTLRVPCEPQTSPSTEKQLSFAMGSGLRINNLA
ncbi:MAG: GAF domain-containing sensor histidine kinase [Candidatus Binatia bacterium]